MPYLVIFHGPEELERRELTDSVIIGRSPECSLSIRDINLSRKHCQLVELPSGWTVQDLNSKNGTYIGSEKITGHVLTDGQSIRIGKSRVQFFAGAFQPGVLPKKPRPADPIPAEENVDLAGTVMGLTLEELPVDSGNTKLPRPQPHPTEPDSYQRAGRSLVQDLVSSSWDSIYANASRPIKPAHMMPKPIVKSLEGKRQRPRFPELAMALQVGTPESESTSNDSVDLGPVLTLPTIPVAKPKVRFSFFKTQLKAIRSFFRKVEQEASEHAPARQGTLLWKNESRSSQRQAA